MYDGLNLKFAGAWSMVHTNVLWKMEFIGRIFDIASSSPRSIEGLEFQCQVYRNVMKGLRLEYDRGHIERAERDPSSGFSEF